MLQGSTCCPFTVGDVSVPGCCPRGFACYRGGYCRRYLTAKPRPPQTECGPCGMLLLLLDVYTWPTSANLRTKTRHTTLTPQPHYEQPHHTTFQNVVRCRITQVWCGCGVGVVCLVFGRRLALVGHHMFISVHYGPKTPPYYFLNKLVKNGTRGRIAAATCCICRDKPDKP